MNSIVETKELVIFACRLAKGIVDANADGHLSKWEEIKLLFHHAGSAVAAFKGIDLIPGELKALDSEELDELYAAVLEELNLPDHSTSRLLFTATVNFLDVCIQYYHDVRNTLHPPLAEPVPE